MARLKSHGLKVKLKHEPVPGKGLWYRVYVGRFKNTSEARAVADDLKTRGIITWAWIKPDLFSPVEAKTPAQDSVAPKVLPAGAPEPETGTTKSQAVSQQRTIQKKTSEKRQPAQSAAPTLQTLVQKPSVLEKASQAKGASAQKKPAVRQAVVKKQAEPLLPGTFSFSSQTTIRAFERDTREGEDTRVLPIYEYMQLDYGDPEEGGWSAHAYGWVRSDLADSAYFEETSDGELLYGYLAYGKPYGDLHLALGRKHIFAGVTNETLDGLQLSAGFGDMLTATLFSGATAASDETSADTTYGGRFAFHPQPAYEVALSYQNTDLEGDTDQRAGIDLSINWSDWLTLQGLSSYNLKSEDWREHNYTAAMRYRDFIFEPTYHFFSYEDYFGTGDEENNLFYFLKDTKEQVTIVGGDLEYQADAPVRLGGRYNRYTYDLRQEDAAYYAALISVDLPGGSQLGGEAGRMDGETADNIYTLYRVYFYWANPFRLGSTVFLSGDAVFQDYDAPVFGKDSATHYSLSGGMHFFDDILEVKLTALYSQDPYFDENVEGVLTFLIHY